MINLLGGELFKINSKIVVFLFISALFFQITAYKFIWGVEWLSRIVNVAVLLIGFIYNFIYISRDINQRVFYIYFLPILLIIFGMVFNLSISIFDNIKIINQSGLIIPWIVCLLVPGFIKSNKIDTKVLWRYFHYFMLLSVSFSCLEYFILFNGLISPRPIITSGGQFLSGNFTILHGLETGELHYRFYGAFMEPGTLAMYLLPVMAYAFLYQKYLAFSIYFLALFLTDSLGGFIGFGMLLPFLTYLRFKKYALLSISIASIVALSISFVFYGDILERYESKAISADVREDNIINFIADSPELLVKYPFGLPLSENTDDAENNIYYKGSNFAPGVAFNQGGFFSLLGYLFILFLSLLYAAISLWRRILCVEEEVVVVSIFCLFPFIFQRTVIWDGVLFSLLYAPFIVIFLINYRSHNWSHR